MNRSHSRSGFIGYNPEGDPQVGSFTDAPVTTWARLILRHHLDKEELAENGFKVEKVWLTIENYDEATKDKM